MHKTCGLYPGGGSVSFEGSLAWDWNHRMWPQPEHLQKALGTLDFYVNTELFWSDSSKMADLVLPACTTFEREEVKSLRGGMFALNQRAVEPVGEAKNDIEIIMELARRMQLKDKVLTGGYESYMNYILEPSGLTLEDLRSHPDGMRGKVIFPPGVRTYEDEPFHTPSGRWSFPHSYLKNIRKAEDMIRCLSTRIFGNRIRWTGRSIR